MGAENSILAGCVWGPHIACPPKFLWEMSPVTRPDGSAVTVFESKTPEPKNEDLLQKSAFILRGLRHPNIIRFIGCGQSSDGFWLATESILPLFTFASDMCSQELCAGLCDILHGLDFLHSKLSVCHNNICLASVYVGSDGTWKLGGLEFSCRFTEATQEFLDGCRTFRHEDSLSPEEKTSSVRTDNSLGYARDVFAFGALVEMVLGSVKEKDSSSQMLEQQMSACSSPDPASRPTASRLLNMPIFKSELIEILKFLRHVTTKNASEKKDFFCNLMSRLLNLPEMAVARRLVVPLQARFVLLDESAVTHVLPHLLTPKGSGSKRSPPYAQGLLPEHLFRQYVINHIYNIFHVYDSHVRLVLLEHFSHYVNMFTRQQLEDDIFLQILLGVRDTDDRLVAASLRALADLVPVLGGDVVVGGVRKPFFFHGMPKAQKVNTPQNMTEILGDHKPLLKDLVATRNQAEKERKMKEREKRREEAKLKREERRNLKEKLTNNKQDSCARPDSNRHNDLGLTLKRAISSDDKEESNNEENDDTRKDVDKSMSNQNDEDGISSNWSDWEDADQRISDEIELELQSMTGPVSPQKKLQTSPSPYRTQSPPDPPPVRVDLSNVLEADEDLGRSKNVSGVRTKGALDLKSQSSLKTRQPHKADNEVVSTDASWEETDGWEPGLEDAAHLKLERSISLSSSTSDDFLKLNLTDPAKHQQTRHKKNYNRKLTDDLGAGLDIKSINIITSTELDFFADMTPSIINTKPKDLMSLLEPTPVESTETSTSVPSNIVTSQTQSTETSTSVPSNIMTCQTDEGKVKINSDLFAMSAVTLGDVGGWDENGDLDLETEITSS